MISLLVPWLFTLGSPPAHAQTSDDEAVEEIIVWANPFLRWEKRWYVETEVSFAQPFRLMAYENREVWVSAVQIRAVLGCRNDGGSRRLVEALCTIEDVGLIGLMPRRAITDARREVFDEVDATLTGVEVQLQANRRGTVPNVDLEGLSDRNQRTRDRAENLRQLMARVVVPFHLKLPKTIRTGSRWFDYDSRLLTMPSIQASSGGVTVAHFMNHHRGNLLVQSVGKATVKIPGQTIHEVDGDGFDNYLEVGAQRYDMELNSVAIFEPDSGIMAERVWSVTANSTASSTSTTPLSYTHVGMLRMLGDADRPVVGETKLVDTDGWKGWEPPK